MQQQKRRSKKGVILLALAIALLVVAFAPAAAFAANTGNTGNMVATPDPTASLTVNLHMDVTGIAGAQINGYRLTVNGGTESALVILTPTGHWVADIPVTLADIADGVQTIHIRVFDSADLTVGTAYDTTATLIRNAPISTILAFTPAGAYGDDDTYWTNSSSVTADFGESTGVLMGTTIFSVSPSGLTGAINWVPLTGSLVGPTGVTLVASSDPDGIYTVKHWAVSVTGVRQPMAFPSTDTIGKDTETPEVTVTGQDINWHSKAVTYSFTVADPGGSGVATAWADVYSPSGSPVAASRVDFTQGVYPFSPYIYTGKVTIPADLTTQSHSYILVHSTDVAGNSLGSWAKYWANIDVQAPTTVVASVTPPGAASDPSYSIGPYANTDVTLNLLAIDRGGNGDLTGGPTGYTGMNAGVDYTEYILGDSTSTPPALSATGTKVDPLTMNVTITQNAPVGPVYMWYRSVDKAVGPNMENWNLVYVFIDKPATAASGGNPMLSDDYPGWWMNTDFWVHFKASDPNSGIAPPGIQWKMGTWHPAWTIVGVGDEVGFDVAPGALLDGIYPLEYKVSDRAGNTTTNTQSLKVDTRAPVTEGASGDASAASSSASATTWINGNLPYVLTATDQAPGSGVAATFYRADLATPWNGNIAATPGTTLVTQVPVFVPAVQGAIHTIDFASVDNARPYHWVPADTFHFGNWEINPPTSFGPSDGNRFSFPGWVAYKSSTVKLDVTAPVVTAMDPMNGAWQKGPAVVNFTGTDVGSGYAHTEWSTDGGTTWHQGEVASITGNSPIAGTVITYHGVDNVGIKSANQTITVKVAATGPTVVAKNVSVKKGQRAAFKFTVTGFTDTAMVTIQFRNQKHVTVWTGTYDSIRMGSQTSRTIAINLKKGKYFIRISAVDQAGNNQVVRGTAMLTVK